MVEKEKDMHPIIKKTHSIDKQCFSPESQRWKKKLLATTTQWIWKKKGEKKKEKKEQRKKKKEKRKMQTYLICVTLPVAPWDSIGYSSIWMKTIHEEPH